ncbi:MAG: hypothetical protein ACPLVF_02080 [Thermovenabulum sp.]|uniref:ParM/StbA family protein n=1 Tax=Thermovenabulum sp. TaxID=3100335 RepID=UPI003C7DCF50
MIISVDVGNGYTKAISEYGRKIIFPSVMAYVGEKKLDIGKSLNYVLKITYNEKTEIVAIGEAAKKDAKISYMTFNEERYNEEIGIFLTLAGIYLTGGNDEEEVELGLGLPISIYRTKKNDIIQTYNNLEAEVEGENMPKKKIKIKNVYVMPQGLSAIYSINEQIPTEGKMGIVDIGYYTTDYTLLECKPNELTPLRSYSDSLRVGISDAAELVAQKFAEITKQHSLDLSRAQTIYEEGKVFYKGVEYDLTKHKEEARKKIANIIRGGIASKWEDELTYVKKLYLVGGGASELYNSMKEIIPQAELIHDPQFANAKGYLEYIKKAKAIL